MKMQLKQAGKLNKQFKQENEELKEAIEGIKEHIDSSNQLLKISLKKQEEIFNTKIEQLTSVINNQQKQIEILNEQKLIKK